MGPNLGGAILKALQIIPVATLRGAQHYKASTGFSSLVNIMSLPEPSISLLAHLSQRLMVSLPVELAYVLASVHTFKH